MAHIHELIDFTICAFIVHDGKVLFVNHKAQNRWLPIGGHIELDEDPEQALFRELKEETGIEKEQVIVMSQKPNYKSDRQRFLYTPNQLDIHRINDRHWHIGIIYFVKSSTNQLKLEEESHKEIKWLSLNELKNPNYEIPEDVIYSAEGALNLEKDFK